MKRQVEIEREAAKELHKKPKYFIPGSGGLLFTTDEGYIPD